MANYNSALQSNNTDLQAILNAINELPEGGVQLPELTNEGTAADMLSGKQLINSDGEVVTGSIAAKTSSDLTASGATVTVPAGYYASQATKSVATATQATPSVNVSSAGLITASATQSAGYVSAGTKSATKQLTTQAAKTVTPSTSEQTAVSSGVYTTGAVKVAAIPSTYVKPSATKGATTYTPTTSDQTIAAGTYCSGAQTIKGDSNLVADNIKSGVSIFGVAGSYEGSGGGSGGDVPTCSIFVKFWRVSVFSLVTYKDGEFVTMWVCNDYNSGNIEQADLIKGVMIDNVVCGTNIQYGNCHSLNGFNISGGVAHTFPYHPTDGGVFIAPTTPGAVGRIEVYDND